MKEFKDKKYYTSYIDLLTKLNIDNRTKLNNKEINPKNLDLVKYTWFVNDIKILIAKYSRGDSKVDLKIDFSRLLRIIGEYWKPSVVRLKDRKGKLLNVYVLDCHIYMRWLLSISILLDVSDNEFKILTDFIERDSINDVLYDFLISSKVKDWKVSDNLSLNKPENKIKEILFIDNKTECATRVKKYLEKEWYKTYKYFGFYNNHKKPESMWLFYGYWAFEVAAIVKIKGIDDSSFKDNQHYPDRLV